jgi:hypothetical protein
VAARAKRGAERVLVLRQPLDDDGRHRLVHAEVGAGAVGLSVVVCVREAGKGVSALSVAVGVNRFEGAVSHGPPAPPLKNTKQLNRAAYCSLILRTISRVLEAVSVEAAPSAVGGAFLGGVGIGARWLAQREREGGGEASGASASASGASPTRARRPGPPICPWRAARCGKPPHSESGRRVIAPVAGRAGGAGAN